MASLDGLLELVWRKEIGAESRELAREALRLIDELEGEKRVKLLAAFFWANLCRGRADVREGRDALWEFRLWRQPGTNPPLCVYRPHGVATAPER
ncbi:MAG: hypothetical protein ACHQ16_06185 [Candidatus Lutacidiplasmatales archaeon]